MTENNTKAMRVGATLALALGTALAVGVVAQRVVMNDYRVDLPDVSYVLGPIELPVVVVALLAAVGCAIVAAAARQLLRFDPRGSLLAAGAAMSVIAGLIIAASFAVMCVPSEDANIGAGIAILFGLPFSLLLLGGATGCAAASGRTRSLH